MQVGFLFNIYSWYTGRNVSVKVSLLTDTINMSNKIGIPEKILISQVLNNNKIIFVQWFFGNKFFNFYWRNKNDKYLFLIKLVVYHIPIARPEPMRPNGFDSLWAAKRAIDRQSNHNKMSLFLLNVNLTCSNKLNNITHTQRRRIS